MCGTERNTHRGAGVAAELVDITAHDLQHADAAAPVQLLARATAAAHQLPHLRQNLRRHALTCARQHSIRWHSKASQACNSTQHVAASNAVQASASEGGDWGALWPAKANSSSQTAPSTGACTTRRLQIGELAPVCCCEWLHHSLHRKAAVLRV